MALCALPGLGWAAVELDVFEPNTPIVAADVNANFDALAGAVAEIDARIPAGTIIAFAGPNAPDGWLPCDGGEVDRGDFAALFSAIGTTYGPGDNIATFNLPDLRGRVALGAGQADGLSAHQVGDVAGAETHALSVAELPAHSHSITDPGHAHAPSDAGNFVTAGGVNNANVTFGGGAFNYTGWTSTNTTGITGTNPSGGGQAFALLPPFVSVQYLIKS